MSNKLFRWLYRRIKSIALFNKIKGKRKNCIKNNGIFYKCKVVFNGCGNVIHIDNAAKMINCKIVINGSNNNIYLGKNAFIEKSGILLDFDGNTLSIGNNTIIGPQNHFSISEGTSIFIGSDCLTSANIHYRTTDSHSILNKNGERINWCKNIEIHDHVWVGANAVFLKGSKIGKDCVVSYGAIVTKDFIETECVIAGCPAKIVKREINWDKTLIKKEK